MCTDTFKLRSEDDSLILRSREEAHRRDRAKGVPWKYPTSLCEE